MANNGLEVPLVIVPPAGASAADMRPLTRRLPGWLTPHPVELPGRGRRWREKPPTQARTAVDALRESLPDLGRFAIWGESLGAYLGLALAQAVAERGKRARCMAIFAVSNAPLYGRDAFLPPGTTRLDADEVLRIADRYGGIPPAIAGDPHLRQRALGLLEADFLLSAAVIEQYRDCVVDADLHVVAGTRDNSLPADLTGWRRSTTGTTTVTRVAAGHFLSRDNPVAAAAVVSDSLAEAHNHGGPGLLV